MTSVVVTTTEATVEILQDGATTVVPIESITTVTTSAPGPAGPSGQGVPTGGTANQLLQKLSGTNYDTGWTSTPSADALAFSLSAAITPTTGQLAWNADEGTLELGKNGVSNYIGAETMVLCRNASNTIAIPKGTAVMFAGTLGASGRIKVAPMISNGSVPGYYFFGVTDQAISGASDGYVTTFGKIRGINTSAYLDGDVLWCNPATAGTFTNTEPQAPNLKLPVAAVIRAGNNGTIFVRWATGSRLQDLHDVEANGGKSDGDVLTYVSANSRWESAPVPGGALAALSDVEISNKINKSVLVYDSTLGKWVGDSTTTTFEIADGGNF